MFRNLFVLDGTMFLDCTDKDSRREFFPKEQQNINTYKMEPGQTYYLLSEYGYLEYNH